jgi:hypothetical protein
MNQAILRTHHQLGKRRLKGEVDFMGGRQGEHEQAAAHHKHKGRSDKPQTSGNRLLASTVFELSVDALPPQNGQDANRRKGDRQHYQYARQSVEAPS